jgi:predicted CXXCH cytochrome family protein
MNNFEPVGKCTICHRDAQVNTPKLNSETGELICDSCGDRQILNVVLIGIEQFKDDNGEYRLCQQRQVYQMNGNVIWLKPDDTFDCAWTHGGNRSFVLHDGERSQSVIEILDLMDRKVDDVNYRCSRCGNDFTGKPSGYPLFAGVSCFDCWTHHKNILDEQRKKGQVCRMCRQPYGACSC